MENSVILNNQRYEVTGAIQEKQITPWIAQIGTGGIDFKNYSPAEVEEYRDFRGGLGKETEEGKSDRFWWSESIETTKEGYITLGPLVTTAGAFGVAPVKILDFSSGTYAFGTSVAKKWNTSTSVWDSVDASALATPTDAIVFKDSTATYLVVCNGTALRCSSNGTTWNAVASAAGSKYLCAFDKRLIGINSTGTTLYYSPRDDVDGTWVSFSLSGDYSTAMDLFEGKLLTTGESVIYLLTDTGLYAIDYWTQTCYKVEIRFPMTTTAMVGMYWNGGLYTATGSGIVQVAGSTVQQWGPDLDGGLPTSYQGYIYDMLGISHWVLIAVSGGTNSSILKRHESAGGWHQVYSSSATNIRCLCHSSLYSPGRLWFGDDNNIKYIQFRDKTHDVTKVSSYAYAASGNLYLTGLSKVSSLNKVAVRLDAITKDVNSDEKITAHYIVNDGISHTDSDWTLLTSWDESPLATSNLGIDDGVSFYDLYLKLKFERGSTTTNTPALKALALRYIALPETVTSWTFTVKALGIKAPQIIDWLEETRDSLTLINFSPDGDLNISEYFVRIATMPSNRKLEAYAAEKDFTITVSEVI